MAASVPMRVAVVLEQALAPVPGGTGRYSVELAAGLARTAAAGDDVRSVTAWHRSVGPALVDGVAGPRRLPLPRRPLVAAWQRGLPPRPVGDVVHAPTLLFPPSRRPVVVTIHDAVPWSDPGTLTERGVRFHRAMAARAGRLAAAVTVPTQAVADELLAVVPELRPDRLHVLGAGVTPGLQAEPAPAFAARVRTDLALPPEFLLILATLEPRKGLDVAVQALAQTARTDVPLLVVGPPGWGAVDLDAAAAAAGLTSGRVRSLGRLDDAALAVVLRAATVLLAPSRAEGFGLPVLEAMSVGTPVICSDVPAMVEVSAGAAVVVERGNASELAAAIDTVLAEESLRSRLRAAGLERAAEFTWDAVGHRAWTLYRSLAGPE